MEFKTNDQEIAAGYHELMKVHGEVPLNTRLGI